MTGPSTSFKECHAELFSKSHTLFGLNNFFISKISFISDKDFLNILARMDFNLSDPISNIIETFLGCAIICQNDSHGSFIVSLSDGPESLLASCVPNLKLHIFTIDINSLDLKINSYNENLEELSSIRNVDKDYL